MRAFEKFGPIIWCLLVHAFDRRSLIKERGPEHLKIVRGRFYMPGIFGASVLGSSRRRNSMYVPHFNKAKTAAANRKSFSSEPPKKIQMFVFRIASAMAKLQPIIAINPDNRSKPGTNSKETVFRINTSVTTMDTSGRMYTSRLTSIKFSRVKNNA